MPTLDAGSWWLTIDGAVERPVELSLDDLSRLPRRELPVVLECAGHRRLEFDPPAVGVQWGVGALSEALWEGASLNDVLSLAGLRPGASFVVLEGADTGQFRDQPSEVPFARALPLAKALDPDTLLAWKMNGEPLPRAHGAPVRAVVPGWYATDSVKWLARISVLDRPFDGPFEAIDYRLPDESAPAGRRMTVLPVQALFTSPVNGGLAALGPLELKGIAWGSHRIAAVEVSIDGGPWQSANLDRTRGHYTRTLWHAAVDASPGEHLLAVRARDGSGTT